MLSLDKDSTYASAKEHLDQLTQYIEAGCYEVKKVPLSSITEEMKLNDLIQIKISTRLDNTFSKYLQLISNLDLESKRILYCVHLLNIKRRNLQSNSAPYDYTFGRPFERYRRAVLVFGLTQEKFIRYN